MGEEKAASLVVAIAKRVQAGHPDSEPIGILVGAAATLYLAGYTDPKDRHVLHAAARLRERLAAVEADDVPDAGEPEGRELTAAQLQVLEDFWPTWQEIRDRLQGAVPESTWRLWLEPLDLCGIYQGTLLVTAPAGIRAWCERRYSSLILEAAADVAAERVQKVSFAGWVPLNFKTCESHRDGEDPPPPENTGGQQ